MEVETPEEVFKLDDNILYNIYRRTGSRNEFTRSLMENGSLISFEID